MPAPDVWTTYKDFLKRKRDYKREWRKRKTNDQPVAQKRMVRVVIPARRHVKDPIAPATIPVTPSPLNSPRETVTVEHIDHRMEIVPELNLVNDDDHTETQEEELHNVSLDGNSSLNNIVTLVEEMVDTPEQFNGISYVEEELHEEEQEEILERTGEEEVRIQEDEEEVVDEEVDGLFLDRWNTVTTRLLSVTNSAKRSRYLNIIEALVEEAW